MDFATLVNMTSEERTTALTLDFSSLDNDALSAALTERRDYAITLFALTEPSIAEVEAAEALVASIGSIETEQTERAAEVQAAADRFAAARATFSAGDAEPGDGDAEPGDGDDAEPGDAEPGDAEPGDGDGEPGDGEPGDGDGDGGATTTASARSRQRVKVQSVAARVAAKTKRPDRSSANQVVITASADVPGFAMGANLNGMGDVAAAAQARARGFAPWDERAAQQNAQMSGGAPVLHKFGVASFQVQGLAGSDLTPRSGAAAEYDAMGEAVKAHIERINASLGYQGDAAMAAAMAWCSPSEVVYNWIADFVVDGLKRVPQINAPRGGLMLTEGPQLLQTEYATGAEIDDFGFGGTETEMEAGYVKTCETIVCPEFDDHRLDFDGYCWKIPILTESTFPELVADAMRVSDVAYAHKMNRRLIADILSESQAIDAGTVYGGSTLDTLEALVQIAVQERRWWNLGENAVMEVTLPQHARDIFKFDMARRSGLALNDVATDQKINAYFANHRLAVDYVSDFDQRYGAATPTATWPDAIRAIMYPAGTFVQAQKDVITLSTVYDAASLSANEYTGVFYEQGIKTIRRGYRSHVVTIPVCTAGTTGANAFLCDQFGSF